MSGSMVSLKAADGGGTYNAYVAEPKMLMAPGIIVIQEIFGINDGIKSICHEMADRGYLAVCPDLFWRQEPGISLTDKTDEEWQKAFQLYQGFNVDKGIEDIQTAIDFARTHEKANGRVGAMGYCLGGLLSYLTAARTDVDSSVSYYGVGIHDRLEEAKAVKKPIILHIAEEDEFVNKEAQQAMHAGLDDNPLFTLYDYAGCDHAFARPGGIHEDKAAADEANARTYTFLANSLC